jgi:acyl-CoA synthetase (NDP forming)
MDPNMKISLDAIFSPKSVAVIGARDRRGTFGYNALAGMRGMGYGKGLFPVNPKQDEVQGLRAYKNLAEIPEEVDMAVIVVQAKTVPNVIQDCIDKGIKGGIMITAGFAELGEEGAELQGKIVETSKAANFNFIGPNCMGVRSTEGKVSTMGMRHGEFSRVGPVSFISQSGTLGGYFFEAAGKNGFDTNKFISCGNQASINFTDLLEYLGEDDTTKVIAGYMEGMQDGRRFLEVAKKVSAKKPVLLFKAGSSEASARAASSHTASMASNDDIFDSVCRQAGVLRFRDFNEMFDLAGALCYSPIPKGNRVAIVSGGGGFCVTTAEACAERGLDLPVLDADTQGELKKLMDPYAPAPVNPVDCIGVTGIDDFYKVIETAAQQDYIDSLIVMPWGTRVNPYIDPDELIKYIETAKKVSEIPEKYGKPVILSGRREGMIGPIYDLYRKNHIPFQNSPVDCATMVAGLVKYGQVHGNISD